MTAKPRIPYTETVGAMIDEIQKMQDFCVANYTRGYDTFVECYSSEDFEDLFYQPTFATADTDPTDLDASPARGPRVTFATAWETLHRLASVYSERQADATHTSRC